MHNNRPNIAIIESNTLAAIGIKSLLAEVVPFAEVDLFTSMNELRAIDFTEYYHFFVSMNILLEDRAFFTALRHKTIVMTTTNDAAIYLSDFHTLCVSLPEKELVRSLLIMQQHAHGGNRNMPKVKSKPHILTKREAEVMVLIVKGYINKEIADKLNISLSTVITHRKNIMDKLKIKSVSALTIYAVVNGYINIDKI